MDTQPDYLEVGASIEAVEEWFEQFGLDFTDDRGHWHREAAADGFRLELVEVEDDLYRRSTVVMAWAEPLAPHRRGLGTFYSRLVSGTDWWARLLTRDSVVVAERG